MPQFRLYAGLNGGFGGAYYQSTDEFKSEEEARARAYEIACDCFDAQEGAGIESWDDFREQARSNVDFENDDQEYTDEEYAQDLENEARESWIDYYVIEVTEENINDNTEMGLNN